MSSDSASEQGLSQYERIRLQNIERNLQFLKSIGLESKLTYKLASPSTSRTKEKTETANTDFLVRKSERIAKTQPVNYGDVSKTPLLKRQKNDSTDSTKLQVTILENSGISQKLPSIKFKVDPHSTRCLDANYCMFLTNQLCQPYTSFGKASVVAGSHTAFLPKFSKYSGVLEWANCVYLWVNMGGADPGADSYANTFLDEGRSFVWFGGSKMTQGIFNLNIVQIIHV